MLAQFENGVGAVSPASPAPIWSDPAAVAAVDGSAVFSVRNEGADRLVRLDPHTGATVSSWPLSTGLSVSAVAPEGRWVALTNRAAASGTRAAGSTEIVVFGRCSGPAPNAAESAKLTKSAKSPPAPSCGYDPAAGSEVNRIVLPGNLRPEAFSVDGRSIFALDYRGDHYRVQTIDVSTGQRRDTIGRDKRVSSEDMNGASVRGVMSADRTLLATLYRNPANAEEPAFVHVLDLEYGWSYCADLPRPFGTGPQGSDVIELTPRNTVVVAATQAQRVAEIHIDEVHTPGITPVDVEYRNGTVASGGSAYRSIPGFEHVIATIPT